jgi:hypothetical protein
MPWWFSIFEMILMYAPSAPSVCAQVRRELDGLVGWGKKDYLKKSKNKA